MGPVATRRAALLGAVTLVAGFQIAPRLADRWSDDFNFEELDDPQGFRRLADDPAAGASLPTLFVGLDGSPTETTAIDERVRETLCQALFAEGPGVPVAAFSDYYCPYCRVLDAQVRALATEGAITLRHHETPIFGPRSDWAARGAIAARNQGQGEAYFNRMIRSPVSATPAYLTELAIDLGLDVAQFTADLSSTATEDELATAASLARLFRFVGTPALVVGRTALQGAISETNLRQLIDLEREHSADHPCA